MLPVSVSFDAAPNAAATDRVHFYANVDVRGIASGAVGIAPATDSPLEIFFAGQGTTPNVRFVLPAVHFGEVLVAARSVDPAGNLQTGEPSEAVVVVNTTPLPPANLRRGSYVTGRQAFSFMQSPQLKGI